MTSGLRRGVALGVMLVAANLGVWIWALTTFRGYPMLLGSAVLAYVFGLRHALDADHIAAIDNVTRKLMQRGGKPLTVGLYFSLGHSTVVILACVAVAAFSATLGSRLGGPHGFAGAGSAFSAGFLLLIAAANITPLIATWRAFRDRTGATAVDDHAMTGGFLARLFGPLFAVISKPWHMYPIGFLFGLGFDTATEISLLALASTQAAHLPIASIMIFPALFTAGMSMVDTADGMLMVGAYGWAFVQPRRKLAYNLTMTAISIAVAVAVGGTEIADLLNGNAGASVAWRFPSQLNRYSSEIGAAMVLLFLGCWLIGSVRWSRFRKTQSRGDVPS